MATVYKKTTYSELDSRNIEKSDESTSNSMNQIISNFFTHFKAKHLS